MNATDIKSMLDFIHSRYHSFFDLGNDTLIRNWCNSLRDKDTELMWAILKEYAATSHYAPQLADIEVSYNQRMTSIETATREKANLIRTYIDDATGINETDRKRYNDLLSDRLDSTPIMKRESAAENIYIKCRQSYADIMRDSSVLIQIIGDRHD